MIQATIVVASKIAVRIAIIGVIVAGVSLSVTYAFSSPLFSVIVIYIFAISKIYSLYFFPFSSM